MKKKNIIEGSIFFVSLMTLVILLVVTTEQKDSLQEALDNRQSVISDMRDEIHILEGIGADLTSQVAQTSVDYKSLFASNEALKASHTSLKEKARTLSTEVQKTEGLNATLTASNKKLIEENARLKKIKAARELKAATPKVAGVTTENKQPSRSNSSVAKSFMVTATAYTAYCAGCSGVTRTGIDLRKNPQLKLIAVDPRIIPLGTKVWVEGYGYAIAGDTGGAIKGNKIDLHMSTKDAAYKWGRRQVQIKVLN